MDRILDVVQRLGLTLIEDCAHTLGAMWKLNGDDTYKHLGTFGTVGVWSLQTNKSINCGEGGLISTSRQAIAPLPRVPMAISARMGPVAILTTCVTSTPRF